jgi:hypothetical protein
MLINSIVACKMNSACNNCSNRGKRKENKESNLAWRL